MQEVTQRVPTPSRQRLKLVVEARCPPQRSGLLTYFIHTGELRNSRSARHRGKYGPGTRLVTRFRLPGRSRPAPHPDGEIGVSAGRPNIMRDRPSRDLSSGVDAKLVHDVFDVGLGCALTDHESGGDLLVAEPLGNEGSDLQFAAAQALPHTGLAGPSARLLLEGVDNRIRKVHLCAPAKSSRIRLLA